MDAPFWRFSGREEAVYEGFIFQFRSALRVHVFLQVSVVSDKEPRLQDTDVNVNTKFQGQGLS